MPAEFVVVPVEAATEAATEAMVAASAPAGPPRASSRLGSQPRVIDPLVGVIDAMLRAEVAIKASVIYERLVAEYGFGHHYQQVKLYVAESRHSSNDTEAYADSPIALRREDEGRSEATEDDAGGVRIGVPDVEAILLDGWRRASGVQEVLVPAAWRENRGW